MPKNLKPKTVAHMNLVGENFWNIQRLLSVFVVLFSMKEIAQCQLYVESDRNGRFKLFYAYYGICIVNSYFMVEIRSFIVIFILQFSDLSTINCVLKSSKKLNKYSEKE